MRFLVVLMLLVAPAYATPYKPPVNVAAAIQTFRAAKGKPWNPSRQPAVDATHVIFAKVPFIGMTTAEVVALLGTQDNTWNAGGDTYWHYMRHNGELGASYRLTIKNGRVAAVKQLMTE